VDNLVDKIVKDVLNRQQTNTTVILSRPNYQREKAKERLLGVNSQKINFAPKPVTQNNEINFNPSPPIPSGTLFTLTMKPPAKQEKDQGVVNPPLSFAPAPQSSVAKQETAVKNFGQAQFIGVAAGNTVGYVIPNLDPELRKYLVTKGNFRAVGVISSRVGAAAQIMATDEAVKKTNTELIRLELARDDLGGPGHGVFALFGAEDVADVIRAVEIALAATDEYSKNVIVTNAGKIETHYSARAAAALNKAFGSPLNQAFGIIIGAPAGVGLLMSDTALKTSHVTSVSFWGPSAEQAFANEVWLTITGDSAAVKSALEAARVVGSQVLAEFGA